MLRNLLFFAAFVPTTIVLCILTILVSWDKSGRLPHLTAATWGKLTFLYSGVRLKADLSALGDAANYVFFANHQSLMDIPIIYRLIGGRRFGFVAKESLFRIPLFGAAMYRAGHIPIDRSNPRKALKSIDHAVEQCRRGVSVVLFPEGTRATDYSRLQEFQIGGMIMALKCGLPVVPLIMHGSGPVMPKGAKTVRPRTVHVRALPPVDSSAYGLKEREKFRDEMRRLMNEAYKELAAEASSA
jgi:1-acyl-sn-glycerol-3-phosphate acyltransferase